MKIYFLLLVCLLFKSIDLFAQTNHINCIIFVDGKLSGIEDSAYFTYMDSIGIEQKIYFDYTYGEIFLDSFNQKILLLNPCDIITIHLPRLDIKNNEHYYFEGDLAVCLLKYDYLIIRITNLNKKKGKYYFALSTPCIEGAWIRKEYDVFGKPTNNHYVFFQRCTTWFHHKVLRKKKKEYDYHCPCCFMPT